MRNGRLLGTARAPAASSCSWPANSHFSGASRSGRRTLHSGASPACWSAVAPGLPAGARNGRRSPPQTSTRTRRWCRF